MFNKIKNFFKKSATKVEETVSNTEVIKKVKQANCDHDYKVRGRSCPFPSDYLLCIKCNHVIDDIDDDFERIFNSCNHDYYRITERLIKCWNCDDVTGSSDKSIKYCDHNYKPFDDEGSKCTKCYNYAYKWEVERHNKNKENI